MIKFFKTDPLHVVWLGFDSARKSAGLFKTQYARALYSLFLVHDIRGKRDNINRLLVRASTSFEHYEQRLNFLQDKSLLARRETERMGLEGAWVED